MKPLLHLWWVGIRLLYFLSTPLVIIISISKIDKWFEWQLNYGGVLLVCAVVVCITPLVLAAGMFPPNLPSVGKELPEESALRLRRMSGALCLSTVAIGATWPLGELLGVNSELTKQAAYIATCLHLVTIAPLYFSRCSACSAFAVSVRPLYPEGTICRCRKCGSFSLWRAQAG